MRDKHLKHLVEYMDKHLISLDELREFKESYVPLREKVLHHREVFRRKEAHAKSLERAREALKEKRKRGKADE